MRRRATDLACLLPEIGTETDITEQQKHPGSAVTTVSAMIAVRQVPVIVLLARRFGLAGSGK